MLTPEGCRERQQRLRRALAELQIDAAVVSDPHEIYYFTGLLLPMIPFAPPALLWIDIDGSSWLVAPLGASVTTVGEVLTYEPGEGSTTHPDQLRRLNAIAAARLSGLSAPRLGWQCDALPYLLGTTIESAVHPDEWIAIDDVIAHMERRKDPDEIDLIRRSIQIDLAAYRAVQRVIQPGVRELDVLAAGQQAALSAAGEVVYHNGDYQSGRIGGYARDRQIEAGELYVVDAWTNYRGYWSDLCRTFIVGEAIMMLQESVFDHIQQVQEAVSSFLKPGLDGSHVWAFVDNLIRQHPALAETGLIHHAGHAVGLRAHELPDLNPNRGGMLEVGNVISVEPGGYFDAIHGGVRLENMYLITETGAENLSVYPMALR